jgi:hypothetical protein
MLCADPVCRRSFKPAVAWQSYCGRDCADRVRHRRAYARRGPRKPSKRYFRMFLSLIRSADRLRKMKPVG